MHIFHQSHEMEISLQKSSLRNLARIVRYSRIRAMPCSPRKNMCIELMTWYRIVQYSLWCKMLKVYLYLAKLSKWYEYISHALLHYCHAYTTGIYGLCNLTRLGFKFQCQALFVPLSVFTELFMHQMGLEVVNMHGQLERMQWGGGCQLLKSSKQQTVG